MPAAAVMAVGTVVAGKMASDAASSDAAKARGASAAARQQAINEFNQVKIPTVAEMTYAVTPYDIEDLLKYPLQINPDEFKLGASRMEDIGASPEVLAAQEKALGTMEQVAREGYTAQERADLARAATEEKAQERGQREAIMQNLQERGIAGSGMELAAKLQGAQGTANRLSQRGLDIQAQAKQRALDALQNQFGMATNLRTQDVGEQSAKAKAADAIAQFNATQRAQMTGQNINAQMAAAAARQAINQQNVDLANQEKANIAAARQKRAAMEMDVAAGKAGQYAGSGQEQAQSYAQEGKTKAQILGGTVSALGSIYGDYAKSKAPDTIVSDRNLKVDIEPANKLDVKEFLENLSGYKYRYKDPSFGEGPQAGVMAQDLEKSRLGQGAVEDYPEGKMVNGPKLTGALAAATADIDERLRRLEERNR